METVFGSLVIMGAVLIIFSLRMMYANNITADQRTSIIREIYKHTDWRQLRVLYKAVTYEDHMYRIIFFRDWKKLYSERLRESIPEAFK